MYQLDEMSLEESKEKIETLNSEATISKNLNPIIAVVNSSKIINDKGLGVEKSKNQLVSSTNVGAINVLGSKEYRPHRSSTPR